MAILEPPLQPELVADHDLATFEETHEARLPWFKMLCLLIAKYCGCFAFARFVTRNGIAIIGWHGVSI